MGFAAGASSNRPLALSRCASLEPALSRISATLPLHQRFCIPAPLQMMYDNPQLVAAYLAAYQLATTAPGGSGNAAATLRGPAAAHRFAGVARGVLDYMLRDMRHPEVHWDGEAGVG